MTNPVVACLIRQTCQPGYIAVDFGDCAYTCCHTVDCTDACIEVNDRVKAGRAAVAAAARSSDTLTSTHLYVYGYILGFGGYIVLFLVTVCSYAPKQQQPAQPNGFSTRLANNVMADNVTWCAMTAQQFCPTAALPH